MVIGINARLFVKDKMEGVATYIFENTKQMVLDHPEDQFIFFFDRSIDDSFLFSDNITPILVYPPTRHPLLWHIWWQWQLPRYLKKYKVDVLYTGEIFMPRKTTVPTVIVSHDLAYKHYPEQIPFKVRKYYEWTYPKNHKEADQIIAVSEFTKNDIVNSYGIDETDIEVIYNATPGHYVPLTDLEKESVRQKYSQGHRYFAYLGSFHPRKNIVNLIKAFNLYKYNSQNNIKLLLMGRWAWHTESIKTEIDSSPYVDDIIVLVDVGEEKYNLVAAAEALCYVSLFEGFGIPILEGFSSAVPVITSNVSSMPEVAGDAALLIDPHSPESIAEGLMSVSSDKSLTSRLIELGLKRKDEFSWLKSGRQTYELLLKQKQKRANL